MNQSSRFLLWVVSYIWDFLGFYVCHYLFLLLCLQGINVLCPNSILCCLQRVLTIKILVQSTIFEDFLMNISVILRRECYFYSSSCKFLQYIVLTSSCNRVKMNTGSSFFNSNVYSTLAYITIERIL